MKDSNTSIKPSAIRSSSMSSQEDEKVIPFLRRLTDMLLENGDVISFFPGGQETGPELGQIVVHDRAKVEAEVLPRYFNHASFASLRRQLNYFNFARVGKGRQRGATYCNEHVIKLEDILRLKRRVVGSPTTTVTTNTLSKELPKNDAIILSPASTPTLEPVVTAVVKNLPMKDSYVVFGDKCRLHSELKLKNVDVDKHYDTSSDMIFSRDSRSPIKKRGKKRHNAIVPFVHLPPAKKIRPEIGHLLSSELSISHPTGILPKNSLTRSRQLKSKENSQNVSSSQLMPTLESMMDSSALYLDLTTPKAQRHQSVHANSNMDKGTPDGHFETSIYAPATSKVDYHDKLNPGLESPNDVNRSFSGSFSPPFSLVANNNVSTNVDAFEESSSSSFGNTSYQSSDEITGDEDIVACNVLLALGCCRA